MGIVVSRECFERYHDTSVYLEDGSTQHISHREITEIIDEAPIDDNVYLGVDFNLYKARDDEQLVSGWANVALDKNGNAPIDWQDDIIEPAMLEKAAMMFMQEYRGSGEMHKGTSKGTVVESIVLTKEKQQAIGIPEGCVPEGWFITVKVHDKDVFEKVKNGTYRMFSIQGTAKRVEL